MTVPASDDLSVYEIDPFTPDEGQGIARYETAVYGSGMFDCFESLDADDIRAYERDLGTGATGRMLRDHAGYLSDWYMALDHLFGDLLTCNGERDRYSEAASLYLEAKAAEYHRVRQDFEYAVTAWTLELDPTHARNYPPATREISLGLRGLTS